MAKLLAAPQNRELQTERNDQAHSWKGRKDRNLALTPCDCGALHDSITPTWRRDHDEHSDWRC